MGIFTARNEVVILFMGGCVSQHALQVVSQHSLQKVSRREGVVVSQYALQVSKPTPRA